MELKLFVIVIWLQSFFFSQIYSTPALLQILRICHFSSESLGELFLSIIYKKGSDKKGSEEFVLKFQERK